MKLALIMLFIMVVVGIAVFGFPVSICQGGAERCCIAEIMQNKACPSDVSPLAHVNFLLEAFKSFSVATVDYTALSGVLGVVLFAYIYFFVGDFLRGSFLRESLVAEQVIASHQKLQVPLKELLRSWLALCEKCDPALLR